MSPRDRILTSLALMLVLIFALSCNPNPQPEALTPVPTLAPAATLTLIPSLEGAPATGGETVASPQPPATGGEPAATAAPAGGDPAKGAMVFAQNCAGCHGPDAQGGSVGPTLVSAELKAQSDDFFRQTILNGRTGTAMPAWGDRLSTLDIEDVIAFLRSKQ
jgi:mono/diheme cytochrome c family protein